MKTKLRHLLCAAVLVNSANLSAQNFQRTFFDPSDSDMNHYNVAINPSTGNYVIAGTLFGTSGNNDIEVFSTDKGGHLLWTKKIDITNDDRALDVTFDAYGDIIVTGYIETIATNETEMYIVKLDPSGNFINDFTAEGFHAAAATNVIHSSATDTYIIGSFASEPLSFPLIGANARILELDLGLNVVNNVELSSIFDQHTSINDIVEVPTGYFVTGSIAIDGSFPSNGQGVLAIFLDHSLNVIHDLSFESTNFEHVGVSAVYDANTDEIFLMSNNSVIHNPQISYIRDVSGVPFIWRSYYLQLDPTFGSTNPAGFQIEKSVDNPVALVAVGYYRTNTDPNGNSNSATPWIAEFEKFDGSFIRGLRWLAPSPNFHAHGGGVLSTFSGEHPYIFNQEILTIAPDKRGYTFISPRKLGSAFAIDLVSIPALKLVPPSSCFEDFEFISPAISYSSIITNSTQLGVVSDNPIHKVEPFGLEQEIFCEDIFDFDRSALSTASTDEATAKGLDISIQPNPVSESFFLEIQNATFNNAEVVIQNPLGQIVYNTDKIDGNYYSDRIDLSNYAEGIYVLRIINGGDQTIKKIIKR